MRIKAAACQAVGLGVTVRERRGLDMVAVITLRNADEPIKVKGRAERDETYQKIVVRGDDGKPNGEFPLGNVESWFNAEE